MDLQLLRDARVRLKPWLKPTPLVEAAGLKAWLKLESFQPTGAFKVRPAINSVLVHLEAAKERGVLASSSGNFAQAVAYAASKLSVKATIVMPSITSPYKIERTRALGAEVVICGPSFEERWETTYRLERETGKVLVHPYDSVETIAGDGTLGLELLEQRDGPFCAIVPASGGGLLAGVALALKTARPECRVIGVQAEGNGSMYKSFYAGARVNVGKVTGIADSLVASMPGERAFELIKKHVDGIVLVSDAEIRRAMRWCMEQQKIVVEPGAATGVAALREGKVDTGGLEPVVVISGANVSPEKFAELILA